MLIDTREEFFLQAFQGIIIVICLDLARLDPLENRTCLADSSSATKVLETAQCVSKLNKERLKWEVGSRVFVVPWSFFFRKRGNMILAHINGAVQSVEHGRSLFISIWHCKYLPSSERCVQIEKGPK